jgi:hypothetical protein
MAITTSPSATRSGPREQAGVLRGLSTNEGGSGGRAGEGDALDDVGDALGNNSTAGNVVGHKKRAGTHHDDVVDDHSDEVLADGVVFVHGLGDGDLGANSVGRRRKQWPFIAGQKGNVEESGESAHPSEHLRSVGGRNRRLHQFDGEVSGRGINAGLTVAIAHVISLPEHPPLVDTTSKRDWGEGP